MIDWTMFDRWPEDTCFCRCGGIFRSHGKWIMSEKRIIARSPCPKCGKNDDCYRVKSDPETMEICAGDCK